MTEVQPVINMEMGFWTIQLSACSGPDSLNGSTAFSGEINTRYNDYQPQDTDGYIEGDSEHRWTCLECSDNDPNYKPYMQTTSIYDNSLLSFYDSDDDMVSLNESEPSTCGKHRIQEQN